MGGPFRSGPSNSRLVCSPLSQTKARTARYSSPPSTRRRKHNAASGRVDGLSFELHVSCLSPRNVGRVKRPPSVADTVYPLSLFRRDRCVSPRDGGRSSADRIQVSASVGELHQVRRPAGQLGYGRRPALSQPLVQCGPGILRALPVPPPGCEGLDVFGRRWLMTALVDLPLRAASRRLQGVECLPDGLHRLQESPGTAGSAGRGAVGRALRTDRARWRCMSLESACARPRCSGQNHSVSGGCPRRREALNSRPSAVSRNVTVSKSSGLSPVSPHGSAPQTAQRGGFMLARLFCADVLFFLLGRISARPARPLLSRFCRTGISPSTGHRMLQISRQRRLVKLVLKNKCHGVSNPAASRCTALVRG